MNTVTRGETSGVAMTPTGIKVPKSESVTGAVSVCAPRDAARGADIFCPRTRIKKAFSVSEKSKMPKSAPYESIKAALKIWAGAITTCRKKAAHKIKTVSAPAMPHTEHKRSSTLHKNARKRDGEKPANHTKSDTAQN